MQCLLCESRDIEVVFRLANATRTSQKLLTAAEVKSAGSERAQIDMYGCKVCGMIQIDPATVVREERYWEDYLNSRAATELYVKYDTNLADTLTQRFGLKGKHCVEIGCGDGYFSAELVKRGVNVTAIEPSTKACEAAKAHGVTAINAYLDDAIEQKVDRKFDAFVCKQVMDLVVDANALLRNLGRILKPGAVGLIDVPSWTKTLLDKRYYSVLPDRVGYYTAATLTKILERNNFHVFETFHGAEDEYVGAYAIYEGGKNGLLQEFGGDFDAFNAAFRKLLADYKARGKTVVGWGAGAKGVTVFAFTETGPDTIKYVIDRDRNRWGLYLPGSSLPVAGPDQLKQQQADAVVITAAMFYKEIVRDLVTNFGFKGDIIILNPLPHVLGQAEIAAVMAG